MAVVDRSAEYILNHCVKRLARAGEGGRHDFLGESAGTLAADISEAWFFPIVDTAPGDDNDVTFVYADGIDASPAAGSVQLVCTFSGLFNRVALRRIEGTHYWAVTLRVPRGQVHRYRFVVDGRSTIDPINPQRHVTPHGDAWSRFFTWGSSTPLTFERWEMRLLDRLTRHILPFNTREAQNFMEREMFAGQPAHLYRLDVPVGVANFIDKVVAREERHHEATYKICLELIDTVLRSRNPYVDVERMPESMYVELYADLGAPQVDWVRLEREGWRQSRYGDPGHFLRLLRRHAWTGAFAHPKWGGNPGGLAWRWLQERYPFDWGRVIEPPLGTDPEYVG